MNTPGYYTLNNGDVISAALQNIKGIEFCRWEAVKYIVRAGSRHGHEGKVLDLKKAIDVLQRWLEYEEKKG